MDPNALVVKSQTGIEEMESRAHGLSHKLRGALIMIDGESTLTQILERSGEYAARVEAQILELMLLGYVLTVDENGHAMGEAVSDAGSDNLSTTAVDDTVPDQPAAPTDMRDFSRPTRGK